MLPQTRPCLGKPSAWQTFLKITASTIYLLMLFLMKRTIESGNSSNQCIKAKSAKLCNVGGSMAVSEIWDPSLAMVARSLKNLDWFGFGFACACWQVSFSRTGPGDWRLSYWFSTRSRRLSMWLVCQLMAPVCGLCECCLTLRYDFLR